MSQVSGSSKAKPKKNEAKPKTKGVKRDSSKFMKDGLMESFLGAKMVQKRAIGDGILSDHL